jgi:hypothetical protein
VEVRGVLTCCQGTCCQGKQQGHAQQAEGTAATP